MTAYRVAILANATRYCAKKKQNVCYCQLSCIVHVLCFSIRSLSLICRDSEKSHNLTCRDRLKRSSNRSLTRLIRSRKCGRTITLSCHVDNILRTTRQCFAAPVYFKGKRNIWRFWRSGYICHCNIFLLRLPLLSLPVSYSSLHSLTCIRCPPCSCEIHCQAAELFTLSFIRNETLQDGS